MQHGHHVMCFVTALQQPHTTAAHAKTQCLLLDPDVTKALSGTSPTSPVQSRDMYSKDELELRPFKAACRLAPDTPDPGSNTRQGDTGAKQHRGGPGLFRGASNVRWLSSPSGCHGVVLMVRWCWLTLWM
jgi:hypothetical protein